MKRRVGRSLSLFLIMNMFIALLAGCGAAKEESAGPVDMSGVEASELHIAIQPSAAFIPLMVCRELGWIEEALEPYGVKVGWNDFTAGPPMNESIVAGESDLGVIGDVPSVALVKLTGAEVVAITAQAADSYAVLVPADSDIRFAADLKGRKVATALGTTGHNLVRKYLATAGLTFADLDGGDVMGIAVSDASDLLKNHEIDAVALWEPSVTRIADSGVARVLALGSECGLGGTNTMMASAEYAKNNPKVVSIVLEQYARAAASLNKISDETWQGVADYLGLTLEQTKGLLPKYNYTVVISEEDMENLNDTISFVASVSGDGSETYRIDDYVNRSYYESIYSGR